MFCPCSCQKNNLASTQKSVLNMASSDSQINKPQRGRPKRAELPDVNINTGAQSINTERASLTTKGCANKQPLVLDKVLVIELEDVVYNGFTC